MTLERILTAAVNSLAQGKRQPHCNIGADIVRDARMEADSVQWAEGYAEPGYQDPPKGIVFANWNRFPQDLDRVLERAGYAIEWSDEWTTCDGCGKAVRTSADSYSWQRSYWLANECEIICRECLDVAEYLESIENNPRTCNTFSDIDPAEYGYEKHNGTFENGFHPGQTDDPRAIYKALRAAGYTRVLFSLKSVGQFDAQFTAWTKAEDRENSEI